MIKAFRSKSLTTGVAVLALGLGTLSVATVVAPAASAAQPVPNHTKLVPDVPRKDTPRISDGEIWDIEVVGNRVFIAGSFTSIADVSGTTTPLAQANLAAYDINTGKIDRTFRPTFSGGGVAAVEASPDGTKLYVGGTFNSINGVARQKVASLSLTNGTPVAGFTATASTNNAVTALAATNSTLYVGGRFTRINGVLKTGLAALNGTTGVVDPTFSNDISGGIGVSGGLTVQQLKLTHDDSKLLVLHTGRQIAGQDRLTVGIIDTATKQLLPWRTRLWDQYLGVVGGVTRIYAMDVAPNDQYFVVTSGSGGDRPPISDTAVAYPVAGGDNVQPNWVARCFDSVYSVAITEKAVYIGGHFNWNESPTAQQPWPGLDNVGYGNGQGLSGYNLGDDVVHREHLGALDPATGTALDWGPISNSFEGNKAMEATSRGIFAGGDAMFMGGVRTGRVAFFDFNSVPAAGPNETTISTPIEGRVITSATPFTVTGSATGSGGVRRVQVEIQDRDTKQYLQDDLVSWGSSNNIWATLDSPNAPTSTWSLALNISGTHLLQATAKSFGVSGGSDATKAVRKFETFSFDDQTPATNITGPSGVQTSTTFTVTGNATDDHGINSLTYWFRDENQEYLQDDGTVSPIYNTFRGNPDVVGAPSATWSYDVTLPHEGVWRASATAIDTAGQADLRSGVRDIRVDSNAVAPVVTISQPAPMTPPFTVPAVNLTPGGQLTFSGTASDDVRLKNVEISLRNSTTRENLGADGTWGVGISAGFYRIGPQDINAPSYNWSYTTPFVLKPGAYTFSVRATDNDDLITATTNRGVLTLNVQYQGDAAPDTTINPTGGPFTALTPDLPLVGTAIDDKGVSKVEVTVFDNGSGRYLKADGTLGTGYSTLLATLANPGGTSTAWSLPITLPPNGDYSVTAFSSDNALPIAQQDPSTTNATARYRYYPGDLPPTFDPLLGQPVDGTAFDAGTIVVTGRANDDQAIARVEVGIVNSLGQYLGSTGTFTSTTPSWRTAFLNSPGSLGSNFSYTTPVIPDGTYSVLVRGTDQHGNVSDPRTALNIVVTHPANTPPVAAWTSSCVANVCTFDGRTSTDENPSALTYSWNFGNGTTATGSVPVRTFTSAGAFTVVLTVRDEWGLTATSSHVVTIGVPGTNVAPSPVVFTSGCIALVCSTSSAGTLDPNLGDLITYTWTWGDGSLATVGATGAHTYALPGTYTVRLTATDGWGASSFVEHTVTMTEPVGNTAPTAAFAPVCVGMTCTMNNTSIDPQGDAVRYSWTFGDGPTVVTTAQPQKVYLVAGTYTITLTVTDGWNKVATTTRVVTVPAP